MGVTVKHVITAGLRSRYHLFQLLQIRRSVSRGTASKLYPYRHIRVSDILWRKPREPMFPRVYRVMNPPVHAGIRPHSVHYFGAYMQYDKGSYPSTYTYCYCIAPAVVGCCNYVPVRSPSGSEQGQMSARTLTRGSGWVHTPSILRRFTERA